MRHLPICPKNSTVRSCWTCNMSNKNAPWNFPECLQGIAIALITKLRAFTFCLSPIETVD